MSVPNYAPRKTAEADWEVHAPPAQLEAGHEATSERQARDLAPRPNRQLPRKITGRRPAV